MLRRSFLSSIALLPGLGWLTESKNDILYNSILGKFKAGQFNVETFYDPMRAYEQPSLYTRWVIFPLEMNVTLHYEKGEITYGAFNVSQEVAKDLATNFVNTFLKHAQIVSPDDNTSKYCGAAEEVIYKDAKFKISSVTYYEEIENEA